MDPGRRKRGIYKGVVLCRHGGLRAWETGSDLEESSQSLVDDRQGRPKDFEAQGGVGGGEEALRKVRGGVADLTWFPLVPGGPSFPG